MTLDSRLIGRRRIYVCTRGLAWQDFEARKERGGGSIEPRRTGCVLFHPCRVPFTFVRIMVSRDFPKGLGRNGREGWRNVPPTKLPAKLPSGNIYSSLLDRPKDLKMRFDDNNNNNNRILLEWKDFNLPLRKFISKMYPAVVKIEMQCVWNSIPGFSFPFLRENIPRIIRCAYAGLHFQLIFQVRDGKGMENMSALYHLSRVSWIIINSIVSCTPISNTNSYSFLTFVSFSCFHFSSWKCVF